MEDKMNLDAEIDSMLDDVFKEEPDSNDGMYSDENSDLFSLIGMTDNEIQKASDDLAAEDEKWAKQNGIEQVPQEMENADAEQVELKETKVDDEQPQVNEMDVQETGETQETQEDMMQQPAVETMLESILPKKKHKAHYDEKKLEVFDEELMRKKKLSRDEKLAKKRALREEKRAARLAKKEKEREIQKKKKMRKQMLEEELHNSNPSATEMLGEEVVPDINDLFADDGMEQESLHMQEQESADVSEMVQETEVQEMESVPLEENKADASETKAVKKNMKFGEKMSLLFFGPDEEEDYPTKEDIAKKEAKKKKKQIKKAEKTKKEKQKKEAKVAQKNRAKEMAVVKRAAKNDKREKIRLAEEEEDAREKRIESSSVLTVAVVLAALCAIVVLGTQVFHYKTVIRRATVYFEKQKYQMAYEQIVGVDVKERDTQIKDKIYCVMYVQKQLDSYRSFQKMQMDENGLDALIKGLKKYNAHYADAKELGVETDLDVLKAQIETELQNQYGVSIDTVSQWMTLDQLAYSQTIQNHVNSLQKTEAKNESGQGKEISMMTK